MFSPIMALGKECSTRFHTATIPERYRFGNRPPAPGAPEWSRRRSPGACPARQSHETKGALTPTSEEELADLLAELAELREDRAATVRIYAISVLAGRVAPDNMAWIKRRIFKAAREYGQFGLLAAAVR